MSVKFRGLKPGATGTKGRKREGVGGGGSCHCWFVDISLHSILVYLRDGSA